MFYIEGGGGKFYLVRTDTHTQTDTHTDRHTEVHIEVVPT